MSTGSGLELNALEDGSILILGRESEATYATIKAYIEENN